jgi:hypothetical protein
MMNYAPDGMAAGGGFGAEAWAVLWSPKAPESSRLPFSVPSAKSLPAPHAAVFQPERVSGFCAAG